MTPEFLQPQLKVSLQLLSFDTELNKMFEKVNVQKKCLCALASMAMEAQCLLTWTDGWYG